MPRLAGFGDEISASIDEQIAVMTSEDVRALELRGAEGQGVLNLAGSVRDTVRTKLADAGVEVFSIGSPIGKVPVTAPLVDERERLKRALDQAEYFGAPRIRVFSFYLPKGDAPDAWRAAVLERMAALTDDAAAAGVVLCLENEGGLYGETVAGCRDLLATVDSPHLRAVHDTANFVLHDEEPYPAGYEALRPYLEYVHVKDWNAQGVQPAGEGAGRFPELLAALRHDGFDGYLSLEPHLGGGPDNFRRAARALKGLLAAMAWPLG